MNLRKHNASKYIIPALLIYGSVVSADTVQISGSFTTISFTAGSPYTQATGTFITDPFDDSIFTDGNFHEAPLQSVSILLDSTEYWTQSDSYLRVQFYQSSGMIIGLNVVEITGLTDGVGSTLCCNNPDDFLLAWSVGTASPDTVSAGIFKYSDPQLSNGGNWSASGPANISGSATVNTVPVPAASWLFGSGLIGMAGVARRLQRKSYLHSNRLQPA